MDKLKAIGLVGAGLAAGLVGASAMSSAAPLKYRLDTFPLTKDLAACVEQVVQVQAPGVVMGRVLCAVHVQGAERVWECPGEFQGVAFNKGEMPKGAILVEE